MNGSRTGGLQCSASSYFSFGQSDTVAVGGGEMTLLADDPVELRGSEVEPLGRPVMEQR